MRTLGAIVRALRHPARGTTCGIWELLVQWVGRAPSDATWENLLEFKSAYPSVQLEDALFVGEGGNVIDSFVGRKYYRRKKQGAAAEKQSG